MSNSTYTLLIVEDFEADRELYRRALLADSIYTYRILEAESVAAGLELCRSHKIDAVTIDYLLPDADGLEFLEKLVSHSNGSIPPVVIVTGQGNESIAVRAIKLGAVDYLVKHDLTPELLRSVMRNAIENASLRKQLQQQEQRFRTSVENMLDCFGIYSAIRDAAGQIVDFRFDYLNAAAMQSNRMTAADKDRTLCEVFPAFGKTELFAEYCQVVETGIPLIKEDLVYTDLFAGELLTNAYNMQIAKLDDGFTAAWQDITAQKQAQLNDRFLYELTQRLRHITTAEEIQWEAVKSLGEYLNVDRSMWYEVSSARLAKVSRDWYRAGVGSIVGDYPLNEFLSPASLAAMLTGEPMAISDVTAEPLMAAYCDNYQQVGIRAFVNIPCLDDEGRWVMTLHLNTTQNVRIWRNDEIQLMQTLVTQLWSFVAQARAVAALRAQEQQTQAAQNLVEQQLGEIEAIYRMAPVGLCFVDTDFRYVRINEQLAQINGLSVAQHIGQTFREILPELADLIEPAYRQVMESSAPIIDLEVTGFNRAQPGVERCWISSFYPQTDERGRVIGVNNVVQEITDRKRLEAERLAAEQERDRFFSMSLDLLATSDFDGYFTRLNPAWEQTLGYTQAELMARPFIEFVHPDDREHTLVSARKLSAGDLVTNFENRYICQDGSYRWLLWSVRPNIEQNLMYAVAHDITERKQIEMARIDAERERDRFFNLSLDLLAIGSFDGYFVRLNPAFEQILGFTNAELMIEPFIDFVHPDDLADTTAGVQTLAQGERVVNVENRYRCKDGSYRWISWSAMSHLPTQLWYAIGHDITDRKQSQSELEARNQELDSFVHVVSHDLKAPLRAVANLSQWIEEDLEGVLTENTQQQMNLLRARIERMSATIDGLLDYARIGRTKDSIEPVAVSELIAETLDSLSPPPTFKIAIAKNLPTLYAKRLLLTQVFANIIGNGIKHHDRLDGALHIGIAERSDVYEFTIADDGPGIAPEQQDRVFEIFQAVNPQKRSDSTGIGLAIVKKIVEAEGGTIRLESQLGRGTTFYFTWPKR
jgi:PAS domain S-box-containing protein